MNYRTLAYTEQKQHGKMGLATIKIEGIEKSLGVKMPANVKKDSPEWHAIIKPVVHAYVKAYQHAKHPGHPKK